MTHGEAELNWGRKDPVIPFTRKLRKQADDSHGFTTASAANDRSQPPKNFHLCAEK